MTAVTVKVTGVKSVSKLLKTLPPKMIKKHARRANRQSAVMVRKAVRRNAPKGETGKLGKLAIVKSRRGKRTYVKSSVAYRTEGSAGDPKNAFYWRFVEFGTRYQAANPFVTRASISQFRPVQLHQFKEIRRGIAGEVRKARQGARV